MNKKLMKKSLQKKLSKNLPKTKNLSRKKTYWKRKRNDGKENDGKEKPSVFFFSKKIHNLSIKTNSTEKKKKADWKKTPTEKNLLKVRRLQKTCWERKEAYWKTNKTALKTFKTSLKNPKKKPHEKISRKNNSQPMKKKLKNTFQSRLKIKGKQKSLFEKRI